MRGRKEKNRAVQCICIGSEVWYNQECNKYIVDLLDHVPITFGNGKCGPWYVLGHTAIVVDHSEGAILMVSSGDKEVDSLAKQISEKE